MSEHLREQLRVALHLSPRELEIALLMAEGYPQKRIALRLGSAVRTVETHVRRIYAKLGVGNQRELIARVFAAYYDPGL